jgi:steroid delta-isomerase-like uncharacterized protein
VSAEANKAVIQRLFDEVFNHGNLEVVDEIVAENVLGHDATSPEPKHGCESVKQVVTLFQTAFPDARYLLFDLIGEDDRVVARWGLRGMRRGTFMGVPPTEKPVSVNGIIIYRLQDQKIVEYWGNFDTLGLMQQLGIVPAFEQASKV